MWNAASADNVATVEVDGEQVHAIGCAARVLQVSKTPSRDRRCVFLLQSISGRMQTVPPVLLLSNPGPES